MYTGFSSPACEGMIVLGEAPHDVCGSSLDMSILWSHCVVQQVLRALPAETKVDGLPRALSNEQRPGQELKRKKELKEETITEQEQYKLDALF